jgi:hypothetical protein
VWFLPFALSLSLAPPFLQRWSLDGILKARELFLFVQLTFACCCYCWTCDRKLVFDINPHQCWELSEDVMVGCQFHIDFPFKVSDHVLLLLVEGLWTCVEIAVEGLWTCVEIAVEGLWTCVEIAVEGLWTCVAIAWTTRQFLVWFSCFLCSLGFYFFHTSW